MNKIVDSIISLLFDKGFEHLSFKVNKGLEYEKLKQSIKQYAESCFNKEFLQIPIEQEFDFESLNVFLFNN